MQKLLQQNALQASNSDRTFISVDLLGDCIDNLKLRKAAGHDGITGEHIIVFGGNDFVVHMWLLFNSMLRHLFVPSEFRFGLIKSVLKDTHGDITSTDMYRPITNSGNVKTFWLW